MGEDANQNWNRPWSMEEIIENAENWSLAGDVALLNTIKAFGDNLLSKTLSISDNVDYLLNDLNEVGLKLEITHNEFQSLRNTQFIESRVYEDDETIDVKLEPKEEQTTLTESDKQDMIKGAVLEGLKIMDKYFDKIEVSISDSEEESEKSYVLQPKDLYAERPLPLVIGTEDWYKKWHAGLAETSSEEESDAPSEIYSDSDTDDHLPKDLLTKGSETSSELDLSSQTGENRPVANSTFNESTKQPDIFESDDNEEEGSLPVKAPISNKNFAEQLAEKLGNVISEREDISVDINKKPIQPAKSNVFTGDLFSDEPPPLDDLDDTILPKNAQSGLFSGGQGLFDDNDEELFWGQQNKPVKVETVKDKVENTQEKNTLLGIAKSVSLPKSSQVSKGLFDSDDSSEEDLFASTKKQSAKLPFLQPFKTTALLFDEQPPELATEKNTVDQSQNKIASQTTEAGKVPNKQENSRTTKKISLFDDDDDLFKDDLFSSVISKKPTSNLFDNVEENETPKGDLFESENSLIKNRDEKIDEKVVSKPKKVISLFSDTEEEYEELDQTGKIKAEDKTNKNDVFISAKVSRNISEEAKEISENLLERQVIGAEKKVAKGLFDEDDDYLFKGTEDGSPPREAVTGPPHIQVTNATPQARKVEGVSLFGSSPPPDDDDWDVKSDNFSDNEDLFSYRTDGNAVASSLFDNEPPSLGPNESSGIVRDQNVTRVDTDDSSFYPYASSSRRLSSDIFSEQQSQDSLFVTKSKTESASIPPPSLDIIPEQTRVSHVDITPSGNSSDLENTTGKSLGDEPVFGEDETHKSRKVVSLFDDSDDESELSEDLKTKTENLPELSKKRQSLFDDILNEPFIQSNLKNNGQASRDLQAGNTNDPETVTPDELEAKSSPEKGRIADLIGQIQKEPIKQQPVSVGGSPRKLKHNLNINVNALLPGFTPKLKDLSKSQSLDLPKDRVDTPSDASTPDTAFFTPLASSDPKRSFDAGLGLEKALSFEDALDNVEVLQSVTKDRAKIPIKRRPSTRRGRREAISRSEVDLSTSAEPETAEQPSKIAVATEKSPPTAVETDFLEKEEPLERPPEIKTENATEQEKPISRKAQKAKDIFGGDGDSDDELFPSQSVTTAKVNTKNKQKSGIFDSEDSDSELFGTSGMRKPKKDYSAAKTKLDDVVIAKKSLFDDGSSDEDLFSVSKKADVIKREPPKVIERKAQSSTLRKLENIETDDDPLSSLLK